WHAVFKRHVSDAVRLQNPSGSGEIRMDLVYGMLPAERLKVGNPVDVLTRNDGRGIGFSDLLQQVCVVPGNYVFHPFQIELFVCLAETNDRLHTDMAEMVH